MLAVNKIFECARQRELTGCQQARIRALNAHSANIYSTQSWVYVENTLNKHEYYRILLSAMIDLQQTLIRLYFVVVFHLLIALVLQKKMVHKNVSLSEISNSKPIYTKKVAYALWHRSDCFYYNIAVYICSRIKS